MIYKHWTLDTCYFRPSARRRTYGTARRGCQGGLNFRNLKNYILENTAHGRMNVIVKDRQSIKCIRVDICRKRNAVNLCRLFLVYAE